MTETVIKVGEYEIRHSNGADFHALRHGERWRELAGDNLVLAMAYRIEQLEQLFTNPTSEMVQAGLAEVQDILDKWDADGYITLGSFNDPVSDDQASDMAVFVLQAMAGKLPKAGE